MSADEGVERATPQRRLDPWMSSCDWPTDRPNLVHQTPVALKDLARPQAAHATPQASRSRTISFDFADGVLEAFAISCR
jgi:hypothetical protein